MNNDFESQVQEAMRIMRGDSTAPEEPVALSQPEIPEQEPNPEYTYGERAGQALHGAASTYGGLSDLFLKYIARQENPEVQKHLTGMVNDVFGRDLAPQESDKIGKFIHGAGEFGAPLPIPGAGGILAAGKAGAKPLTKYLAKEGVAASGASAAMLAPSISDEGSYARIAEDLAKSIYGAKAAQKIVSPSMLKSLKNAPLKASASILSRGSKPNVEALALAEKYGIDLPFNVGMGNKAQNFMANNYFKSIFVSDAYKEALNKSNDSMVNSVKKSIDTLGDSNLKPSEASIEYRQFLKNEEEVAEKIASELYDKAGSLLKQSDKVVPTNTISAIQEMRPILTSDIQSSATKKVARLVGELASKWGIIPSSIDLKEFENNPMLIEKVMDAFSKNRQAISVSRLDNVRKELGRITKYDPDIRGVESLLSGLRGSISQDIKKTSNKAFLSSWEEANSFFKKEVADRFITDISRSIMTGEAPVEAFNKMNSAENVRMLEKIAGDSPKAKEIVDSLKKAKVRDIFSNAIDGDNINIGAFTRLFNKKEKGQELLESLLGKKEYNKLSDISKIATEYQKSGRELLNTSGTAIASSDIAKAESLLKTGISVFLGGGIGYGTAGIGGAAVGVLLPKLLSRLASNPEFVNQSRAYAIARAQGREKYARNILNKMVNLGERDARYVLSSIARQEENEEPQDEEHIEPIEPAIHVNR